MKISDLRRTMILLDDCYKLARELSDNNITIRGEQLPHWLKDDVKHSIETRRQNLVEKLQDIGVDVET